VCRDVAVGIRTPRKRVPNTRFSVILSRVLSMRQALILGQLGYPRLCSMVTYSSVAIWILKCNQSVPFGFSNSSANVSAKEMQHVHSIQARSRSSTSMEVLFPSSRFINLEYACLLFNIRADNYLALDMHKLARREHRIAFILQQHAHSVVPQIKKHTVNPPVIYIAATAEELHVDVKRLVNRIHASQGRI
jgi:hypothetical protein